MKVTLKLSGGFVHTVGFSRKEIDVEPGTTIADILATIAIDRTRPMIIARNGWVVSADEPVADDDRILVSPIFSGG
jgi:sulfur carrier protein ThiS